MTPSKLTREFLAQPSQERDERYYATWLRREQRQYGLDGSRLEDNRNYGAWLKEQQDQSRLERSALQAGPLPKRQHTQKPEKRSLADSVKYYPWHGRRDHPELLPTQDPLVKMGRSTDGDSYAIVWSTTSRTYLKWVQPRKSRFVRAFRSVARVRETVQRVAAAFESLDNINIACQRASQTYHAMAMAAPMVSMKEKEVRARMQEDDDANPISVEWRGLIDVDGMAGPPVLDGPGPAVYHQDGTSTSHHFQRIYGYY